MQGRLGFICQGGLVLYVRAARFYMSLRLGFKSQGSLVLFIRVARSYFSVALCSHLDPYFTDLCPISICFLFLCPHNRWLPFSNMILLSNVAIFPIMTLSEVVFVFHIPLSVGVEGIQSFPPPLLYFWPLLPSVEIIHLFWNG